MNHHRDELKGRFTAWMKVLVKRAKINFLRRLKRHSAEIPIGDENITQKLVYTPKMTNDKGLFDFDSKLMSDLFDELTQSKKRVLTLLFVCDMTPEEIAKELGCSVQHVYNQRSLALKELRKKLEANKLK